MDHSRQMTIPLTVAAVCFVSVGWPIVAHAAEPTIGECLAASESSLALRNQHKLHASRKALLVCSAQTCPGEIRDECVRRIADLNLAIPTMIFEAKDAGDNDISLVAVKMDGQILVDRLDGPAIPIDPGVHDFTFDAPGHPVVHRQFVVREGEKGRRERINFVAVTAEVVIPASPASPSAGGSVVSVESQRDTPSGTKSSWGRKEIGLGLGVAGAVGLVTGVTFYFVREHRAHDFNDAGCLTALPNDGKPGCQSKHDGITTAQYLSLAGFISGAILGGLGAYFYFKTPGDAKTTATAQYSRLACSPSTDLGILCGGTF